MNAPLLPPDLRKTETPVVEAPPALSLVSITFEGSPKMPGIRQGALATVTIAEPHPDLKHWRVVIRGASVFFVSPPGWTKGKQWFDWNPQGRVVMHEVPRASCVLQWDGATADAVTTIAKGQYESPMLGGPLPDRKEYEKNRPGAVPVIDSKDLGDA